MKIISICPSNTELLTYLQLEHQLIAIDDFSDWPSSIQHLPRLGPDLSINMDLLESMEPELVIASLSVPGMEKNIEELERRKIPHLVLNPNSLQEIADDLRILGKACGVLEHAEVRAAEFESFVATMKKIGESCEIKPSLYWEWWPNPIFTPGGINWLTEVSEIAGGVNLFADVELASVQTDWNDVLKRNPDYVFLAWVGVQHHRIKPGHLLKRPGASEMSAIKLDRLHVMKEWLYCRPSPRLLEGALKLATLIHPKEYENLTLPEWIIEK
ncbi:cobalamin-binding protein [Viridibacillus arvi]|uniref:cobalamin-binding protein n=1 Tax=Viridibacillus arvi TaxID=263475 RepID=UPI00381E137C